MTREQISFAAIAVIILFAIPLPSHACTFCAGSFDKRQTIRERATGATIIVHGTLADSQFTADGRGTTNLQVGRYLKSDAKWGQTATITIPQYLPVIGDTPRDYLLFAAIVEGKLDVTSGMTLPPAALEYVKRTIEQPASDSSKRLNFYFPQLDSKDATISADAFLEFAKASDQEIAKAAAGFDVAKIRNWLTDSTTPAERLGVYSVLLGLSGKHGDELVMLTILNESPRMERVSTNLGGLLAGTTLLNAKLGWEKIGDIATNSKAPFDERLAALGTVRYFQTTRPKESRQEIVSIYKTLAGQGDLADIVAENLRRWEWWESTAEVLTPFDESTHRSPIVRQALVRYALTCPNREAKDFIDRIRKSDATLVERVEEGLKRFTSPNP